MKPPSPTNFWRTAALAVALGLVTLLLYLPVRHHEFLNWDDQTYVVENDFVRGGITGAGLTWAFTQSHAANWHPATWLSHMLDCQWFGLNAGAHHLMNVGLHALNAALLFLLLQLLTGACWRSLLVAALFSVHPLRVESVAWVAERKDVLCACFGILCLIAYARYVNAECGVRSVEQDEKGKGGKGEKERSGTFNIQHSTFNTQRAGFWYALALVFFALGLMSKPMLVTWPFVLLLLDYWPLKRNAECGVRSAEAGSTPHPTLSPNEAERATQLSTFNLQLSTLGKLVLEKLPFFALTVVSCVVTYLAQQRGGAVATLDHIPLVSRLGNAALAYVHYLGNFIWPHALSPIYPLTGDVNWLAATAAALLLVGISVACWQMRQRSPSGLVGWLWFLGTLVPVIGIVQVGSQAFADRYTYIPMIGLGIAVIWGLGELVSRRRIPRTGITIAALAVLALLSWRTREQLGHWRNTETLFRRTLELNPNSVQALNGLGGYLVESGRTAEGRPMVEKAVQLQPSFVEALGALALALESEGNYAAAIRQYEATLKINPDQASALNNLAWLRASCADATLRNGAEAVRLATRACELTRHTKPVFIGTLAAAHAEAGDFQTAITTAERAAQLATQLNLSETAARNRELIALYRQGKAAHGGSPGVKP